MLKSDLTANKLRLAVRNDLLSFVLLKLLYFVTVEHSRNYHHNARGLEDC
jgi:hypothetical protein